MALLAPFDRPLALRLRGDVARPRTTPSPSIPPSFEAADDPLEAPGSRGSRSEIARFLTHALLGDQSCLREIVTELEASLDEHVVVWSPCLCTGSRGELLAALLDGDDALAEMTVRILGVSESRSTTSVEWRAQGRFDNVGFLNDDLLVEPSGTTVDIIGVLVVVFDHARATHIRCYYDGLDLLEQVVRAPGP